MTDDLPPVLEPVVAPVVEPVADAGRRTSTPVVVAALLLGAVVAAASVLAAVRRPPAPPEVPTRFGTGTRARVEALRDRATTGLLALRTKEGDFTTRPGSGVDPGERKEATAMGVLGLAAARRLGARNEGLERAFLEAKAKLFTIPRRGIATNPSRSLMVSANAASILALSIGGDPVDATKIPDAVKGLLFQTEPGPPVAGWTQGIAARAFGEVLETGRAALLGPNPYAAVPTWDTLGDTRDSADQRVSEALALVIKSPTGRSKAAEEIFAKVVEEPIEWAGEQTDLGRWTLRAWLASRVPGGRPGSSASSPPSRRRWPPTAPWRGGCTGIRSPGAPASSSSCGRAWTCARRPRTDAAPGGGRASGARAFAGSSLNLPAPAPLDLLDRLP